MSLAARVGRRAVFAALFLVALPEAGFRSMHAQGASSAQLQLARDASGALASGLGARYVIEAEAGDFIEVRIAYDGSAGDVGWRLADPEMTPLAESGPADLRTQRITWIADARGTYRLELSRLGVGAPVPYTIRVSEQHQATDRERQGIALERRSRQAADLRLAGTRESLVATVAALGETIAAWRARGDPEQLAEDLRHIGVAHRLLGHAREAIAALREAAELQRADVAARAMTLNDLGAAVYASGDAQHAMALFEEALVGERLVHDRRSEAKTLNNIGTTANQLGDMPRALDAYQASLEAADQDDMVARASTLSNIGGAYANLGDIDRAEEYLERALRLRRSSGDERGQGQTLYLLGNLSQATGREQKALVYLTESLSLRVRTGDRSGEGYTLHALGSCYDKLGEPRTALDYYERARRLRHEIGNGSEEADTLMQASTTQGRLGMRDSALASASEALRLMQSVGNPRGQGEALTALAGLHLRSGASALAVEEFQRALPLVQQAHDINAEAAVAEGIGSAFARLGRGLEGVPILERGRELATQAGNRVEQIALDYALGLTYSTDGRLAEARTVLERAVAVGDAVRADAGGADVRARYFATVREIHELLIDTLMRLDSAEPGRGHAAEAFNIAERSRARSLLELLSESQVDLRAGVAPQLVDRAQALERAFDAKRDYLTLVQRRAPDSADARNAQQDLNSLSIALEDINQEMRANSSAYAALTETAFATVASVQAELLDDDTALLEFSLGEARSYGWTITRRTVTTRTLPPRAVLDRLVRTAYRRVSGAAVGDPPATEGALRTLGKLLLGGSALPSGVSTVAIVSDGALDFIPFAALDAGAGSPLILHRRVVMAPSASTLAQLRRETAARPRAPKAVVTIADPVFDRRDPRVNAAAVVAHRDGAVPTAPPAFHRDGAVVPGTSPGDLRRLQYSRREAEAIQSMVPTASARLAVDFDASRTTLMDPSLGSYRIVHIATHGLVNSQHPELSGLVLSLVDRRGAPQPGFVQSRDLYQLRLGAELVVLSACQTALGEQIQGEGLMSLTRPFMHAGVPRVLASLWDVPDRATSELMTLFYRGLLLEHRTAAEALRSAQLAIRQQPKWAAPYYWSGFVLQGDWR